MRISSPKRTVKTPYLQGQSSSPHHSPQVWIPVRPVRRRSHFPRLSVRRRLWTTAAGVDERILALRLGPEPSRSRSSSDEAHLSAKRPPAEAQARLQSQNGDACRTGHSQAPPREGPQAALCVARAAQEPSLPLP